MGWKMKLKVEPKSPKSEKGEKRRKCLKPNVSYLNQKHPYQE